MLPFETLRIRLNTAQTCLQRMSLCQCENPHVLHPLCRLRTKLQRMEHDMSIKYVRGLQSISAWEHTMYSWGATYSTDP